MGAIHCAATKVEGVFRRGLEPYCPARFKRPFTFPMKHLGSQWWLSCQGGPILFDHPVREMRHLRRLWRRETEHGGLSVPLHHLGRKHGTSKASFSHAERPRPLGVASRHSHLCHITTPTIIVYECETLLKDGEGLSYKSNSQ